MIEELHVVPLMPFDEAAVWATPEELKRAMQFGSERRREEYLTWRAVVRQRLGRDVGIGYDKVGAPILRGRKEHISVAHNDDRVAVLFSSERCAVDIERWDRSFERVRSKYLTEVEQQCSSDPDFLAVAWCAKEVLYKFSGQRELDILRDLHILAYDGDSLTAQLKDGEPVELSVLRDEEYLVVYLTAD